MNCERLGLSCSSDTNATLENGQDAPASPPRLRGVRACEACREKKIRCSGTSPQCVTCKRRRQACIYPALKRPIQDLSPRASVPDEDEDSPVLSVTPDDLLRLIDVFFNEIYPLPSYAFMHPATTKARCRDGLVHRPLAQAIAALTLLYTAKNHESASEWIHVAEQSIWENLEQPSIPRLQTLLLVIHYRMELGNFQRAFMLAAIAARSAAAMRLNHERPDLDPIAREVRRRIVWSLKIVERYFSIGLPEFELCPFETIYLDLPIPEEAFGADVPGDYGAYSLHVRLESVRRDIMKLNRGVALCDQPFPSLTKLIYDVERDLREIGTKMPTGTSLSVAEIPDLLENPWLPRRILVIISWHQCHCDLYRLLLRDYPEAAPSIVIDAANPTYIATAERACLRHAISIVQILTNLNQQSTRHHLLEYDTAICAYHATRLILYISRSGKTANRPSSEFAKSRADLTVAALQRFFPSSALVNPIIEELQRIIGLFAQQEQAPTGTEYSNMVHNQEAHPEILPSPIEARQRLAIHSLLRQAEFPHDDKDEKRNTGDERDIISTRGDGTSRIWPQLSTMPNSSISAGDQNMHPSMIHQDASPFAHIENGLRVEDGWMFETVVPDQSENWQFPLFATFERQDLDPFLGTSMGS